MLKLQKFSSRNDATGLITGVLFLNFTFFTAHDFSSLDVRKGQYTLREACMCVRGCVCMCEYVCVCIYTALDASAWAESLTVSDESANYAT